MTVMTVTWGGTVFNPQPDDYRITGQFIGSAARMADGTLRVDYVAEKARITLRWTGLSYSQLQALRSLYEAKAASEQTLVLFDGRTYTVIAAPGGWQEQETIPASATALWYGVTLTFDEV
jgi:hypothetical protein